MTKFANSVKKFLVSEDGPTAVEYAVMLALIIVLCIVVIRQVGTSASKTFSTADSRIRQKKDSSISTQKSAVCPLEFLSKVRIAWTGRGEWQSDVCA